MSMGSGSPVEFEFSSADASTAAPLVLREAGSNAARALAANERLILTSLNAVIGAAITVRIIADTDGDGDVDAGDSMSILGQGSHSHEFGCHGMSGALGVMPKVIASGAGQIDMTGTGVIVKG